MYGSLTFLQPSNFAVFDVWYFPQYCLQRDENCANCSTQPALSTFAFSSYVRPRLLLGKWNANKQKCKQWRQQRFAYRELKQPRRRRQQKPHKFAYSTMKNSIFARFARAFFIFWHFEDVLVLSTTWNDLFCSCVDDVSRWKQMFNFVLLCPKRWFQFSSRIVGTHFSSIMTLNNWKMMAETRSYIFRWRSRFRRRRVCLSSLFCVVI